MLTAPPAQRPARRPAGAGSGHVPQASSYYGQTARPGVGLLAATRNTAEGLSGVLACELAPLGIHVTLVELGPTASASLANLDLASIIGDYLHPFSRRGQWATRSTARRP
jgi:NAD(P)-dependent dehydrogenase (short-subunit alcohol dehydrogenase family)